MYNPVKEDAVTADQAIQISREAMIITLLISAPMLGFGLIVGLFVSIFQAVTQINEMTLTFIPKILGGCSRTGDLAAVDDPDSRRFHHQPDESVAQHGNVGLESGGWRASGGNV